MKAIAVFFVSVALLSAADSAPSGEIGKQGASIVPNLKNPESAVSSHVAPDPKMPQDQKKNEIVHTHGASDSEQPGSPTSQPPTSPQPSPPTQPTQPSPSHHTQIPAIPSHPNDEPKISSPKPPTTPPTVAPTSTTTISTTTSTSTTSTTITPSITTTPKSTTHPSTTTPLPPSPTPPSSTANPSPSTPAPKPAERHFDGPSFIGGAVLVLGLGAICGVLYMFYKARTDQNYRTL